MSVALVQHSVASTTQGGTYTTPNFETVTLNVESDPGSIVSLSSNQFTLAAGKYVIKAFCNAVFIARTRFVLENITDTVTEAVSNSYVAQVSTSSLHFASIIKYINIDAEKAFEIQARAQLSGGTTALGQSVNLTGINEVYANVLIEKLS